MRFVLISIAVATACAQTIETQPVAVDRGSANLFRILFKARADKPVAALQWEMTVPEGLEVAPASVAPASGAESAGKSVACALRADPKDGKVCVCILAGGMQVLRDGAIAIVKISATAGAKSGHAVVGLRKIQGVSADLKKVEIAGAEVPVTIR